MLSILISIIITAAVVGGCISADIKSGTILIGILSFIASYYLVGALIRKKIKAVQAEIQAIMEEGQQRIHRKIQQAQTKPGANIKLLQRQVETDQKAIYKQALNLTDKFEPFKKWNPLMGRQIDTMRFQFLYQLKEFDQVDALLASGGIFKGPMFMEPMAVAMKMARQYKNKDIAGVEKSFKRYIKWFRGERGTLLYGLMSWVYVKTDRVEEARQMLLKAKDKTHNETLTFNWERLSNDKPKSFSNEGLGEEWYGLYLENPPQPKQQRVRAGGKGRRPF
ncbi:MAG TPA: hypothetical protein VIR63_06425 [Pontiella sp.]